MGRVLLQQRAERRQFEAAVGALAAHLDRTERAQQAVQGMRVGRHRRGQIGAVLRPRRQMIGKPQRRRHVKRLRFPAAREDRLEAFDQLQDIGVRSVRGQSQAATFPLASGSRMTTTPPHARQCAA